MMAVRVRTFQQLLAGRLASPSTRSTSVPSPSTASATTTPAGGPGGASGEGPKALDPSGFRLFCTAATGAQLGAPSLAEGPCPPDRTTVDAHTGQANGCQRHAVYRVICEPGCGWVLAEPVW